MEPEFAKIKEQLKAGGQLNQLIFQKAIANHAATIAQRIADGEKVSDLDKNLHDAVLNGYLQEMSLWEYVAPDYPGTVLLLPKSTRDRIEDYIKKYVYEEKVK